MADVIPQAILKQRRIKAIGVVVLCATLLAVAVRAIGVEPRLCESGSISWTCRLPGLWLNGDVATEPVSDWSFTDAYPAIKVETRDWGGLAYSVTTWCVATGGELYLVSRYENGDAPYPNDRRWNRNVTRDPRVRLKIGDRIYQRTLVHVTDAKVRKAVVDAQNRKYPTRPLTVDITEVLHVRDPARNDL